jgi:hypothetical protein
MYEIKKKLRIENLDSEQVAKAADKTLLQLRLKCIQLWNKHFEKSENIVVGSLNRNDLLAKYRMLLKEMRDRSLEHSTEGIDRQVFKRAMQIRKVGLDIDQLCPITLCDHAVFVKEDFAEEEDVTVVVHAEDDEPNEQLEALVVKMLDSHNCEFVYTKDFVGKCIPLFRRVLLPVQQIEKVELADSSSKFGDKKFETEVPIIPVLKSKKEERVVYGIVYEPDVKDSQGDEANAEEIRKAAYQFMEEVQSFKVMHKGQNVRVRILENYIAPVDFKIEDKSITKGSWVLVTRILDPKIWKLIKKGKLTGYSMAGYARE